MFVIPREGHNCADNHFLDSVWHAISLLVQIQQVLFQIHFFQNMLKDYISYTETGITWLMLELEYAFEPTKKI